MNNRRLVCKQIIFNFMVINTIYKHIIKFCTDHDQALNIMVDHGQCNFGQTMTMGIWQRLIKWFVENILYKNRMLTKAGL
jgi:hypothetical protein